MLLLLLFVVAIFIRTRINFTIQHPHSYLQTSETGGLQNSGAMVPVPCLMRTPTLIFSGCLLCPVPRPNLQSDEELTTNETETLTSVLFRVILFSLLRVIVKEMLAVSALLSQENIRCGPEERGHHASPRLGCGAGLRTHIYCYRVYSKPTHFNIQGPGAGLGWADELGWAIFIMQDIHLLGPGQTI